MSYTVELYVDRTPAFEQPNFQEKYDTLDQAVEKYDSLIENKTNLVVDENTIIHIEVNSGSRCLIVYEYDHYEKSSMCKAEGFEWVENNK